MIRPQEIRNGPSGAYATRQRGFDKHWGRAVCYITINRNIYWWQRITVNTAIDLRENTDPCSPVRQYQIIREEALTLDLETMVPGPNNSSASSFIADFRPGVIVENLFADVLQGLFTSTGSGILNAGASGAPPLGSGELELDSDELLTTSAYGAYVIERSNVEISRDDFTSLRITVRALGYGTNTLIAAHSDGGDPVSYADELTTDINTDTVDPDLDIDTTP